MPAFGDRSVMHLVRPPDLSVLGLSFNQLRGMQEPVKISATFGEASPGNGEPLTNCFGYWPTLARSVPHIATLWILAVNTDTILNSDRPLGQLVGSGGAHMCCTLIGQGLRPTNVPKLVIKQLRSAPVRLPVSMQP